MQLTSPVPRPVRAAQIASPSAGAVDVVTQHVAAPGPGEVLVRSAAAGICGSDVELLHGTRPPELCRYPVIPGHEWSGTVEAVAEDGTGLRPGQRVVCEGMFRCGGCRNCRDGMPNLCEAGYQELGFTRPGGLAERVLVPATHVHPLPDSLSLHEAALLEPSAVVAHAFMRAPRVAGRRVAIVGDGTLGQLAAQFALAAGALEVVMYGAVPYRLELAGRLGAHGLVDVSEWAQPDSPDMDVVIEAAGSAAAVELALTLCRRGGAVVCTGIAGGTATLTLAADLLAVGNLTVLGVMGATPASWGHAVALASSGRLDLTSLITHVFPLGRAEEAFAAAAARDEGTLKVLIEHEASP